MELIKKKVTRRVNRTARTTQRQQSNQNASKNLHEVWLAKPSAACLMAAPAAR
jgi:hypothetical protein